MGTGKGFEDALIAALETWVGDDGVVMHRRQSFKMRRGQVQSGQEVDIMVDSIDAEKFLGFEAKSRQVSSRLGLYFSQIGDQFDDQQEYADKSGRDVLVAVELKGYEGEDAPDPAYLVPLALFVEANALDRTKVTWEEMERYGICIGHDREYDIDRAKIDAALFLGHLVKDTPIILDDNDNTHTDEDWDERKRRIRERFRQEHEPDGDEGQM